MKLFLIIWKVAKCGHFLKLQMLQHFKMTKTLKKTFLLLFCFFFLMQEWERKEMCLGVVWFSFTTIFSEFLNDKQIKPKLCYMKYWCIITELWPYTFKSWAGRIHWQWFYSCSGLVQGFLHSKNPKISLFLHFVLWVKSNSGNKSFYHNSNL